MNSLFQDKQRENPQHRSICDSMEGGSQRYSVYEVIVFEHPLLALPESMGTTNVAVELGGQWLNIEPDAVFQHTHTLLTH